MNKKAVKPFLSYAETPGEVRLSYECRFLFGRQTGFMRPKSRGEGTERAAERGLIFWDPGEGKGRNQEGARSMRTSDIQGRDKAEEQV